jgi:hypothetical protein
MTDIHKDDRQYRRLFGWYSQTHPGAGVTVFEPSNPFIPRDWACTVMEDGSILPKHSHSVLPVGRWFVSFRAAKCACLQHWGEARKLAGEAIEIIQKQKIEDMAG